MSEQPSEHPSSEQPRKELKAVRAYGDEFSPIPAIIVLQKMVATIRERYLDEDGETTVDGDAGFIVGWELAATYGQLRALAFADETVRETIGVRDISLDPPDFRAADAGETIAEVLESLEHLLEGLRDKHERLRAELASRAEAELASNEGLAGEQLASDFQQLLEKQ